MTSLILKNILTLAGGILFTILFYNTSTGINSLLFISLIAALMISRAPDLMENKAAKYIFFGTLLSALMVVIHNTPISRIIYNLSFFCLIGIWQQRTIRFLWYGFALGLMGLFSTPIDWYRSFRSSSSLQWKQLIRWGSILILPLVILPIFIFIYANAVPEFGDFIESSIDALENFLEFNTNYIIIIYFIFGVLITGSFLFPSLWKDYLGYLDGKQSFEIIRKKKPLRLAYMTMGLKQEFFAALITIALLNVLLFTTNIFHIWDLVKKTISMSRTQQVEHAYQMSQSIHAATEALSFSILLAIAVLVIFFRKNLNFYPNNRYLIWLTYAWIIQNALLIIITFGHDYLYFFYYGMTEYRLFIVFFLFLVGTGLLTVYLKIHYKKSTFFLLTTNAWILYFSFITLTCFNWSAAITHYNLRYAYKENIDVPFLYNTLSDKNIPYLLRHKDDIPVSKDLAQQEFREGLFKFKVERFQRKYKKKDWRSWNLADYRSYRALKRNNLLKE